MAARAEKARKRRQLQAGIGAGAAVLLVLVGAIWLVTSLGDDSGEPAASPSDSISAGPTGCVWTPDDTSANPNLKDVGTPPAGEPRTGKQTMTITFASGTVTADVDLSKVPCTAASFTHLASKKFFDNTACHRLTTEGLKVLQCGDPTGTGSGGPTYKMAEENKPVGQRPTYPKGSIAMANTGQPGSTGSQFFIVYGDSELSADYTLLGTVTSGLDVIEKIAAGGHDGAFDPNPGGGKPKNDATIKSLAMGPVTSSS
jgi:peptidyl-prolyl cis-trans isomerase B (cyclophilin B)